MNNLFYYIALFIVIIWSVVFLGYETGAIIHLLLVVALMALLLQAIRGNKTEIKKSNFIEKEN